MEFVKEQEVLDLLKDLGIEREQEDELVFLEMARSDDIVQVLMKTDTSAAEPKPGATVVNVSREQLPRLVDGAVQRLHLRQVLLIPLAPWRRVFDCVAFAMATNEDWQDIDAAATVELNQRDPLLCEPGDFHTLEALVTALLENAEETNQGLYLTSTASPVLVEIVPDGAVRFSVANRALADELLEMVEVEQ